MTSAREKFSELFARSLGLQAEDFNAEGRSVKFDCGCFIAVRFLIDEASSVIEQASFRTNGCPAMIAAGLGLKRLQGRGLQELHGLEDIEPQNDDSAFRVDRGRCSEAVTEALRTALAGFRDRRVAEFTGERALICSCFGIGEDNIEEAITGTNIDSLDALMDTTRAGTGCGSCRMLLQEMIETSEMR
ncbi:MAG: (2Fe-2S)-binding protein [Acidobacteria bacterium]|nr:(2Fe-2S)-binding protein [Acidobacteriota bacterium]